MCHTIRKLPSMDGKFPIPSFSPSLPPACYLHPPPYPRVRAVSLTPPPRSPSPSRQAFKVPLSYTLQKTGQSNAGHFLATADRFSTAVPLPVAGPVAFAVDGSAIFPPYNNNGG